VEVDDHDRRLAPLLLDERLDRLERVRGRIQRQRAQQVDHGDLRPVGGRCDGEPAPRGARGHVRRPDHTLGAGQVGTEALLAPRPVPECDHVGPRGEELVRELAGDPAPVRGVLAVDDAEVDRELGAEPGEALLDGLAAGRPEDVGEEEDPQGRASVAAG